MDLPAPARRPRAIRRNGVLVGTKSTVHVSEEMSPSYVNHAPHSVCEGRISGGRGVQELAPERRVPVKDCSFESTLKAQRAALQRSIEEHLNACSSAAATAPESPHICGKEERSVVAGGGVVQESVAAHQVPMKDCSFECTVKAQALALQRKFEEHLKQLNTCSPAAATAPESPRIGSDCGEGKRYLAANSDGVQELVPAHRFPMKDSSFESALNAQRKFEEHLKQLNVCSSAATTAPDSLRIDSDCGKEKRAHKEKRQGEARPACRPKAIRRNCVLVGIQSTGHVSEEISPSYFNHAPRPACEGRISGGRHVRRFPMKNCSFERALNAQRAALQLKFEEHLNACSSAVATAPESPHVGSDFGKEQRSLAAGGGVVQELGPGRRLPMMDCSFECALRAQAVALQRTIDAHLQACAAAATEAPEPPRADSDCTGEQKRPLAVAGASGQTM